MEVKKIFKLVLLFFALCFFAHKATAEIQKEDIEPAYSTYIEMVLEKAENNIEKNTIRRALFGKEEIAFLIKEINSEFIS